jgi:CDGSH-type Zn-finger protein
MIFNQAPNLFLRESNSVAEQLTVGIEYKLNQSGTCETNYKKPLPRLTRNPQSACYYRGDMATKVTIVNNGPVRIEGDDFTIYDSEGNAFDLAGRTVISLCRCGMADNKPFCDGTHGRSGFTSQCKARQLPPPKPKI